MLRRFGIHALCVALWATAPAGAAIFTVTNNTDNGVGSLRAAIDLANASGNASDTIEIAFDAGDPLFNPGHPDTIILARGLPGIDVTELTIDGSGQPNLAIENRDVLG